MQRDFVICQLKNKADSDDMAAVELEHGQPSNYTDNQNHQVPFHSETNPTQVIN